MEPRLFALVPQVAPVVTVHVHDDRNSFSPDEDLVEIGITMPEGAVAVALNLEDAPRRRPLWGHRHAVA